MTAGPGDREEGEEDTAGAAKDRRGYTMCPARAPSALTDLQCPSSSTLSSRRPHWLCRGLHRTPCQSLSTWAVPMFSAFMSNCPSEMSGGLSLGSTWPAWEG